MCNSFVRHNPEFNCTVGDSQLSFSELNSVESTDSIEFVEYYFQ